MVWEQGASEARAVVLTLAQLQIDDCYRYRYMCEITREEAAEFEAATADAVKLVSNILNTAVHSPDRGHETTSSAQDDKWELAYGKRSGFHVAFYKQKWDDLEDAPLRTPPGDDQEAISKTGGSTRGFGLRDQFVKVLQKHAAFYLASHPGLSTNASNHINWKLEKFVKTGIAEDNQLLKWRKVLNYRLYIMDAADRWCRALGLDFPPCSEVDWQMWRREHEELFRGPSLNIYLSDWPMFDEERPGHENSGSTWPKGKQYLACAMAVVG